jgi:hypothetical protein
MEDVMSIEQLNQYLIAICALFVAFHGLVLAVGGVAKLVSTKLPHALDVVDVCSKLSTDVGWVIGLLRGIKPPAGPTVALLLFVVAFGASGCLGTFDEAKASARIGAYSAASQDRCESLSDRQAAFGAVSLASATLAAPTGLTAIPVSDDGARSALIAGSVVLAANAAATGLVAEQAAKSYVAEGCAK